jgi:hypothetical protein
MRLWMLAEHQVAAYVLTIARRLLGPSMLRLNDQDLHAGDAAGGSGMKSPLDCL